MKIIIDSLEQHPWSFKSIKLDKADGGAVIDVETMVSRLPVGTGDYSIDGYVGQVSVERKSAEDLISTLLSFRDRRPKLKSQLLRMQAMDCRAVIVEASLADCLIAVRERGRHTVEHQRKIVLRTCQNLAMKYHVPWFFCDCRQLAEIVCFRLFETFLKRQKKGKQNFAIK